jgi:hypothetical protein
LLDREFANANAGGVINCIGDRCGGARHSRASGPSSAAPHQSDDDTILIDAVTTG